jgi:hypothetical protein
MEKESGLEGFSFFIAVVAGGGPWSFTTLRALEPQLDLSVSRAYYLTSYFSRFVANI